MTGPTGLSVDLQRYLQQARDSLVRSLEGLPEHDVRRPFTPTGTNLLGIVKHLVGVEVGYLVESVGREAPLLPWNEDGSVWEGADMWARADESREWILGLYRTAWQLSDASIADLPLDAPATVAWWPEERRVTTFGHVLVRTLADTAQHAGHADILRELVDGQAGRDRDEQGDAAQWAGYVARIQAAADAHR
ncbi:MAG TPA: DinB family protein [Ornithinibacter sp.]|nr:DinB family protein [Ornithinibacter sp.]